MSALPHTQPYLCECICLHNIWNPMVNSQLGKYIYAIRLSIVYLSSFDLAVVPISNSAQVVSCVSRLKTRKLASATALGSDQPCICRSVKMHECSQSNALWLGSTSLVFFEMLSQGSELPQKMYYASCRHVWYVYVYAGQAASLGCPDLWPLTVPICFRLPGSQQLGVWRLPLQLPIEI